MRDSTQSDYCGSLKRPRFAAIPFWGSKPKTAQPSRPNNAKNLKAFVREHLQAPDQLRQLADCWGEWAKELASQSPQPIPLDHRHVSVQASPGQLSFSLSESEAEPYYQHLQHQQVELSQAQIFPIFVIYLSLLALAENPKLWHNYCLDQSDDLLFSVADFQNPATSIVFRSLRKLPQPIPRLTQQLQNVCLSKYPNIPSLVLPEFKPSNVAAVQPRSAEALSADTISSSRSSSSSSSRSSSSSSAASPRRIKWLALFIEILEMVLRITLGALSWLGTAFAVFVAIPVRSQRPAIAKPTPDDLVGDAWAD